MLGLLLDEGAAREVGYRGYVLQGKGEGEAFFLPGLPTGERESRVHDFVMVTACLSRIDNSAA